MQKIQPRLSIRPTFDPGLATAEAGLAAVAGAAVGFFLLATFAFILLTLLGAGRFIPAGALYGLFFLVGALGSPVAYFEIKKKAHARSVYNFYDDYFEYQDFQWYITRQRRRVRYIDVTDVTEHATVLQTRRTLTSIFIDVPRMGRRGQNGFVGVRIRDVPERADLAGKIIALVEEGQRRYYQAPPAAPADTAQAVPAAPPEPPPVSLSADDVLPPSDAGKDTV